MPISTQVSDYEMWVDIARQSMKLPENGELELTAILDTTINKWGYRALFIGVFIVKEKKRDNFRVDVVINQIKNGITFTFTFKYRAIGPYGFLYLKDRLNMEHRMWAYKNKAPYARGLDGYRD